MRDSNQKILSFDGKGTHGLPYTSRMLQPLSDERLVASDVEQGQNMGMFSLVLLIGEGWLRN